MAKISVVINTLNEEKNLPQCLSSVKNFADEIIVVDMNSEDATRAIAKKAGAKVFLHEKTNYVEPARNFAISKATGEWILILDADEEASNQLKKVLQRIVANPEADYFRIPRKNLIFGKWIKNSRWWPDYNIRFFKKGFVSWNEVIHSVPMTTGKGADLAVVEENAIVHHHYDSLEQYIDRLNRYTTLHAKLKVKDGYKFSWQDILQKPSGEFLSRYFFGEGYKDGLHGLALSLLQSFSELCLYLKVWQLEKFEEKKISFKEVVSQMKDIQREQNYWIADSLIKERGGIINHIKRKFKF